MLDVENARSLDIISVECAFLKGKTTSSEGGSSRESTCHEIGVFPDFKLGNKEES